MEASPVINLICMETVVPKRRFQHSAGAAYIFLILLTIGAILLANMIEARWQIPRIYIQPTLYLLIAGCAVYVYRFHSITYRYTLTDEVFVIEQIAGAKTRLIAVLQMNEVKEISANRSEAYQKTIRYNASVSPKKTSIFITVESEGNGKSYRISPSEEFIHQLNAQWQLARGAERR